MAQPFIASGVVPQKSDTKLMLLQKMIAALGGNGVNACKKSDTLRMSRLKIERIYANSNAPG